MTTDRFHEAQPPPKGRLPLVPIGSRSALRILRRPILGETEPTQYSHHIVPIAHRAGRRLLQIKSADDKQPQLDALEALLARPDADMATRRRIEQEIRTIRAGVMGERDAAYEIEFHLGSHKNQMTIHDLRIECDGRVAQIDHLIINRLLDIWVCESKHFAEGVAINEHGEWVAFYGQRPQGIPSPVEQNRRHIAVLADVFSKGLVPLPKRLGLTIKPQMNSLVLVSNGARISRPRGRAAASVEGLETVIKVDQLWPTLERAWDQHGVAVFGKVVGQETVEPLARQLVALHVPAKVDWAARFGLSSEPRPAHPVASTPPAPRPSPIAAQGPAAGRRPVCATCGRRVSDAVIAYCQAHAGRFGGAIFCMDCQKQAGQPSPS